MDFSPMLSDLDDPYFDTSAPLGWGPADDAASDPRTSISSSEPASEPDWQQLDLAFDKYTTVFDPQLDNAATGEDANFNWQLDTGKHPGPRFDSIPFPVSPILDEASTPLSDVAYASHTRSPPQTYQPFPRAASFAPPTHYAVFSGDDVFATPPDTASSPSEQLSLYGSPWMAPSVVADSGVGLSPPQRPRGIGSAPRPIARPLVLAHRSSLSSSLPSSPYQQPFFHHSAPDSYSPIRHYERRFTTSAVPADDAAARKRKRTPDLPEKERDKDKAPQRSELHPPKQAPSTWQVFFADWLEEHRARNPRQKLNVAQAAKEAGQVYHNLKPDERERLKQRALAAKEDRDREVAEWKRKLTPDDIKRENAFRAAQRKAGKSRKGNLKDPNAPKKPLSAYFMFLQKIRSSPQMVQDVFGDETETTKQSVLAAAKWRSLTDAEKKPFLVQAEHEKIEYENARRLYEDRGTGVFYRSSGEIGENGSSTSVLAYPLLATEVATDDEGDASEGFSDPAEA